MAARLGGSGRTLVLNALAAIVVSVCLPWFMGLAFLRPMIVIPLACLSVFLVADLAAESFAQPHAVPSRREFIGRAIACALMGWAFGMAMLLAGLAATNLMNWEGEWLLPPAMIVIDAGMLSLAASVFVAGVAVCVGRRRILLKLIMLVATAVLMYGCSRSLIAGRVFLTQQRITGLTWMASAFLLANGAALVAYGANAQPTGE